MYFQVKLLLPVLYVLFAYCTLKKVTSCDDEVYFNSRLIAQSQKPGCLALNLDFGTY